MDEIPPHPAAALLRLDGFEGPLDELLGLARRGQVDLARISLAALMAQSADAMAAAIPRAAADWVVMAAWIIWLKSRLLLPQAGAEAPAVPEPDPTPRDQRARLQNVTAWLEARPRLGWDLFGRDAAPEAPRAAGYLALFQTCLDVLLRVAAVQSAAVYCPPVRSFWTVHQALARLAAPDMASDVAACVPVIPEGPERVLLVRAALAATFVAALELARLGTLELSQDAAFAPVRLVRDRDNSGQA